MINVSYRQLKLGTFHMPRLLRCTGVHDVRGTMEPASLGNDATKGYLKYIFVI
jgi:hypothetical protein